MACGLHREMLAGIDDVDAPQRINMNRHLERYLGLEPGGTEPA
ncbi:MAG: hypothetical protein OXC06_03870 [Acidimicrobiaceae bacterium]|nr:hypothetical protein [Acidimicrobiaceae bacterium]